MLSASARQVPQMEGLGLLGQALQRNIPSWASAARWPCLAGFSGEVLISNAKFILMLGGADDELYGAGTARRFTLEVRHASH